MITLSNPKKMFMALAIGTVMTATLSSCDKNDDNNTAPQTIADVVSTNPSFSVLKAAVEKAELGGALSSGTLTVFAPDNDAFAASNITLATIGTLTKEELVNILKYHVVGSSIPSGSVPASDAVVTLQGQKIFASKNANGVFVNGVAVKSADRAASNGVIHVISSVLQPPTKTIAQLATETPTLSYLLAAVVRAGLADAVSGQGKFTVFAPTDSAFRAAGFATAAAITAADESTVAGIVSAHVLPTNVFASDLIEGATAQTAKQGTTLTVGTNPPSVKITGSTNPASRILVPSGVNIIATNGVVHLIDRVLQ